MRLVLTKIIYTHNFSQQTSYLKPRVSHVKCRVSHYFGSVPGPWQHEAPPGLPGRVAIVITLLYNRFQCFLGGARAIRQVSVFHGGARALQHISVYSWQSTDITTNCMFSWRSTCVTTNFNVFMAEHVRSVFSWRSTCTTTNFSVFVAEHVRYHEIDLNLLYTKPQ